MGLKMDPLLATAKQCASLVAATLLSTLDRVACFRARKQMHL